MDPATLLRKIYERDRDALFAHLHPDYVCRTPGTSQIAGVFAGAQGMRAHIEDMQRLTDHTFRPVHGNVFLTDGQWAMVPVHLHARRHGRQLDQPAFGIWRFKDGLLIEHWENPTDMAAFDTFWS